MRILNTHLFLQALPVLFCLIDSAMAAVVEGQIKDEAGNPVVNAVITAYPSARLLSIENQNLSLVELDQRNREFIPYVLAVQTGSRVLFPNNDHIRHHVYSFSEAKRFEIKLYKGIPADPVKFDKPGVVVLGCNIHDWMIAYVYITDAPYFAKTNELGHWMLELPVDKYRISVWHPDMEQSQLNNTESLPVTALHTNDLVSYNIKLNHIARNGKPPTSLQAEGYKGEP